MIDLTKRRPGITSKRGPNVTTAEHQLVVKMARQCISELCKNKYELPMWRCRDLHVRTKARSQCSQAWGYKIVVDVMNYRKGDLMLWEYASITKDPVIGGGLMQTPGQVLSATVAHEVAHYVKRNVAAHTPHLHGKTHTPHGTAWQWIYRQLRIALVNG